jgi:predicted extracellular nuclease
VPSGVTTSFTLDPDIDFVGSESCTVTVFAAQVADQDTDDPPDTMAADFSASFNTLTPACFATDTAIGAVQGTGNTAAITGAVTVQGTVVGDFEGPVPAIRGFYLQDAGDGNPNSSDGIFVFNGNNNSVSAGQVVQVTGNAGEFSGQTQLSGTLTIEDCGSTNTVTPTDVSLPVPTPVGGAFWSASKACWRGFHRVGDF